MKNNNKLPLVSVIITYYQKKIFLKQTLDSIYNQSYRNYELIFVYDDKDKNDLEFVRGLLKNFNKCKIILNNINIGVAKSRNKALKFCRGKYIALVDADDLWNKNKLIYQLKLMIKKDLTFSFTSYKHIDEDNKIIGQRKAHFDPQYHELIKSNCIGLSTVMFSKKILKNMKFSNLTSQEDYALWLKLSRMGYKLSHIKKSLVLWRKTKNSLSSNLLNKLSNAFKIYYYLENYNLIFSIYCVLVLSYNKLKKIT